MEVPMEIVDRLRYLPNYDFHFIDEVAYLTMEIHCRCPDSRDPERAPITVVHPTRVPEEALESDLVMLAFIRHCLIQLAIHEVDEWFRCDGELVRDPHDPRNLDDFTEFVPAWEPGA